jgi:hypothetical protein
MTSQRNQKIGARNEINHETGGNQIGLSSNQMNTTNDKTNKAAKLGLGRDSDISLSRLPGTGWYVMIWLLIEFEIILSSMR